MVIRIQFCVTYLEMILMVSLWRGLRNDNTYNKGTSCTNKSGRDSTGTSTDQIYPIKHSLTASEQHKKSKSWGCWMSDGHWMIKIHLTLSTWVSDSTINMNRIALLRWSWFHKHSSKLKFKYFEALGSYTVWAATYWAVCMFTKVIW